MMHTLERYFIPKGEPVNEMTDGIAEALLRTVIKYGTVALENPRDYQAQSEIMWAGSLSHNGITGLGRNMDFSVHQLGHELGGRWNVAHGASLTTMWASWARYNFSHNPERFANYAEKVWGAKTAEEGIDKTEAFFKSIGLPTCFTELEIGVQSDDVLNELAYSCVFQGTRKVGTFNPLDQNDIFEIYKLANR